MIHFSGPGQLAARWLASAIVVATLAIGGCAGDSPAPADGGDSEAAPIVAEIVSTEPGQIELAEPEATFSPPDLVRFAVKYRFTKGGPTKHYLCEITFPGTDNQGAKPMSSWELSGAGVIRDGIRLSRPPVDSFEIRVSEADSPQAGYHVISNIASGDVVPVQSNAPTSSREPTTASSAR